jgi:dihydroflavonol-4-reductase
MIALCPATVLGPYDYRITPSMVIILNLANGSGNTWEGGLNFVDVRDVAAVHAAAVDSGEPGRRYIIGGANLHLKEIGQLIKKFTGVAPRHLGTGRQLSFLIAGIVEMGARLTGSEPPFSRSLVHEVVQRYGYFDTTLTNHTFGLTPRRIEDVIRDCVRWLLHLGKIKPSVAEKLSGKPPPDPEW